MWSSSDLTSLSKVARRRAPGLLASRVFNIAATSRWSRLSCAIGSFMALPPGSSSIGYSSVPRARRHQTEPHPRREVARGRRPRREGRPPGPLSGTELARDAVTLDVPREPFGELVRVEPVLGDVVLVRAELSLRVRVDVRRDRAGTRL